MKIKKWKSRVAMALCVAMTGILVGCGATGEEESSVDMSEAGGKNTIVVLNYGEYIDTSVLKQFQKETGIKVLYEESYLPYIWNTQWSDPYKGHNIQMLHS